MSVRVGEYCNTCCLTCCDWMACSGANSVSSSQTSFFVHHLHLDSPSRTPMKAQADDIAHIITARLPSRVWLAVRSLAWGSSQVRHHGCCQGGTWVASPLLWERGEAQSAGGYGCGRSEIIRNESLFVRTDFANEDVKPCVKPCPTQLHQITQAIVKWGMRS